MKIISKTILLCLSLICFFLQNPLIAQSVWLNEFMSKNDNTLFDFEEDSPDWIELYNTSDTTINLAGYYLSDNIIETQKWMFPSVEIEANGHLLVFASGKDSIALGELHTNFSIQSEGEPLILTDATGMVIDLIEEQELSSDESYGRTSEGSTDWIYFLSSTPNAPNALGVPKTELSFSHNPGHYLDEINLEITHSDSFDIFYTTDGSEPNTNSDLFSNSILLGTREGEPDVYSIIQCTTEPYEPLQESKKANIIRARAFDGELPVSKIYTQTYLIDADTNRYSLPIVSLVSEADYFFDDNTGICVHWGQEGKTWERDVHFEYFEENEIKIAQDCGIRIQGGSSKAGKQKPFKLYARTDYGPSKFNYPFFEDKDIEAFDRLILRSPREWKGIYYVDELVSSIAMNSNVERQAQKQVVVFLNGEYWGVYHLREKIDEHYLKENLGVDEDSCTIVENNPLFEYNCNIGNCEEYLEVVDIYEGSEEINDSIYNELADLLDIDNFIQYQVLELYTGNTDWPFNNIRRWKSFDTGKWRHILYDLDFSMHSLNNPMVPYYFSEGQSDHWAHKLGQFLMEYKPYKEAFIAEFENHLNNQLKYETVLEKVNELSESMAPEMEEFNARFDLAWDSIEAVGDLNKLINFTAHRPCVIQEQLEETFGVLIDIDPCSVEIVIDTSDVIIDTSDVVIDTTEIVIDTSGINDSTMIGINLLTENILAENQLESIKIRRTGKTISVECDGVQVPLNIHLYSLNGQLIYSSQLTCSQIQNTLNQDIYGQLGSGLYLLQISHQNSHKTFKLIKSN